jgi:hypothetical protein
VNTIVNIANLVNKNHGWIIAVAIPTAVAIFG